MTVNVYLDRGNGRGAMKIVAHVTCDSCRKKVKVAPVQNKPTDYQLNDDATPRKNAAKLGWHTTLKGKDYCPDCHKEHVIEPKVEEPQMNTTTPAFRRLVDGKTNTGIDVFIEGEPVSLPLLIEEIGEEETAKRLGLSIATVSRFIR